MSVLGQVLNGLKGMSLLQLLLAFLACIGYAVAQGGLLGPRTRPWAGLAAFAAAVAFTLLSDDWMAATMLVAFAVAGLGVFVAMAWLLSLWVAPVNGAVAAADVADAENNLPRPDDAGFAPARAARSQAQSA